MRFFTAILAVAATATTVSGSWVPGSKPGKLLS